MDFNVIMSAIGSVGFPIVACCAMFWLYNKTITDLTNTLTRIDTTIEYLTKEIKREDSDNER